MNYLCKIYPYIRNLISSHSPETWSAIFLSAFLKLSIRIYHLHRSFPCFSGFNICLCLIITCLCLILGYYCLRIIFVFILYVHRVYDLLLELLPGHFGWSLFPVLHFSPMFVLFLDLLLKAYVLEIGLLSRPRKHRGDIARLVYNVVVLLR